MIIDTLVVIVMLVSPVDTTKRATPKTDYKKLFEVSDKAFKRAWEQTKEERDKVLNFDEMRRIVEELKRNSVKPKI